MRLATNSKFTLPLKNSSRVDRVHASEKHKLKRYLEGSLEDIEARQAADTKAFDPVKILEKSNLAKNSKINIIRNSSGMPHSPIGSLRTKTFENKDLQQVLADQRKRKPTGSPASRIFKSALSATNKSTAMYENKRKLKQASASQRYMPQRPQRPNGYIRGCKLPLRAHQQYVGYLNGSDVIFRNNSPRPKFLRMHHQKEKDKKKSGNIRGASTAAVEEKSLDFDEDLAARVSMAFQHRFGVAHAVPPEKHRTEAQPIGESASCFENVNADIIEEKYRTKRKHKKRRRRKKRKKKHGLISSMIVHSQKLADGSFSQEDEEWSGREASYDEYQVACSINRRSMTKTDFANINLVPLEKSYSNIKEENMKSGVHEQTKENGHQIISDPKLTLPDDNFHIFESALRSTENEFFRCESNIPKDLLYMLYNNSKYMSVPKNTRLDLGGDAENALYVLYEGHVKSQADQDILEEGIAIGCDTLFEDFSVPFQFVVVSAEIKVAHLSRQNFLAVVVAYNKEKGRLDPYTGSYMFTPILQKYRKELQESSNTQKYKKGNIILDQETIPNRSYIVIEGSLTLIRKDRGSSSNGTCIQKYCKGDVVAFFECFAHSKESSKIIGDLICTTDCVLGEICSEKLRKLSCFLYLQKMMFHFSKVEILSRLRLMTKFSVGALSKFATSTNYNFYKAGKTIVKEGDVGSHMYIIKFGEVGFTKNLVNHNKSMRVDIGHLFKNDFFGEGVVVSRKSTRRATGIAIVDTLCLVLPASSTKRLFGNSMATTLGRIYLQRKQADDDEHIVEMSGSDFHGLKLLGHGSYGELFYVRNSISGKTFVMKKICKSKLDTKAKKAKIIQERQILSMLKSHPFICKFIRTFRTTDHIYFLMEAVLGGTLYSRMQEDGIFNNHETVFYCAQIALILDYLHANKIIFRDLKPENLLLAKNGYLKLIDFGLSKVLPEGKTYTMCGTPTHMAPEIYSGKGHNRSVDWWSFGVVVHELVYGHVPFFALSPQDIYSEITVYSSSYDTFEFPKTTPSASCSSFIKRLLNPHPDHRLGMHYDGETNDIFLDDFFKDRISWIDIMKMHTKAKYIPKLTDSYDTTNFRSGANEIIDLGFTEKGSSIDLSNSNLPKECEQDWFKDF